MPGVYRQRPRFVRARRFRQVYGAAAAALVAGSASLSTKGTTTAGLTATDASGGTAPYSYQWEYQTNGGGFSNFSGATSLTLNATGLTDATQYGFRLKYTDAAAATATSNTVTFRTDVAPNNANIRALPEAVVQTSTYAAVNCQGNYLDFAVTVASGESVAFNFNTTRLNGLTAGTTPTVALEIDGMLYDLNSDSLYYKQLTNAANTQTITISGLSAARHLFRLWVRSMHTVSGATPGPWGTGGALPPGAVELTSVTIGTNSTLSALVSGTDYYADNALFVGDSVTVGVLAALPSGSTTTTASAANNDSRKCWPALLRDRLRCEVAILAQGGLGYSLQNGTFQGSATANPPIDTANGAGEKWLTHNWNGSTRTWSSTFKYCWVQCGPNDAGALTTTHITNCLTYLRTKLPTPCWLFQSVEAAQRTRSTQVSALASPQDAYTVLLDYAAAMYSTAAASTVSPDASHMNAEGHGRWAAIQAGLAQAAVGGTGGGGPILSRSFLGM